MEPNIASSHLPADRGSRHAAYSARSISSTLVLRVEAFGSERDQLARVLALGGHQFIISLPDNSLAVAVRLSPEDELDVADSCGKGTVVVNWTLRTIASASGTVRLSPTELRLFATLMEHKGAAVSYEQLARSTWPALSSRSNGHNLVSVYIHSLRRRLCAIGAASVLTTVRGLGYRLIA